MIASIAFGVTSMIFFLMGQYIFRVLAWDPEHVCKPGYTRDAIIVGNGFMLIACVMIFLALAPL